MDTIKKNILLYLYNHYETHIYRAESFACRQGCSTCCTQNVTLTSLEGSLIAEYIKKSKDRNQLTARCKSARTKQMTQISTNRFARMCMEQIAYNEGVGEEINGSSCIFLQENNCMIYAVRPFGCRCFASSTKCTEKGVAEISNLFLEINTTITQLIEHIDRGNVWGDMQSVLLKLLGEEDTATKTKETVSESCPGFLIEEKHWDTVMQAIEPILSYQVHPEKNVRDLLL